MLHVQSMQYALETQLLMLLQLLVGWFAESATAVESISYLSYCLFLSFSREEFKKEVNTSGASLV